MIPAALFGLLSVPDSTAFAPAPPQASRNVVTTFFGGHAAERVQGVALASGNILIAGSTHSDFTNQNPNNKFPHPTPPFYDESFNGEGDAYVAILDPTMTSIVAWTYLGGSEGDRAYFAMEGPAPDRDIYVVGFTESMQDPGCTCNGCQPFPIEPPSNCFQNGGCGACGCFDVFVAKLSSNLKTLHYSTVIGGLHSENPRGSMVVASDGTVYVSGRTNSSNFPVLNGNGPQGVMCDPTGPDDESVSYLDAFLLKLDTTGALLWSTYFGGLLSDNANANVRLDESDPPNPKVFIAGGTRSTDLYARYQTQLPPGFLPYQINLLGPSDAFIAKFDGNNGGILALTFFGGSGVDTAGFNDSPATSGTSSRASPPCTTPTRR